MILEAFAKSILNNKSMDAMIVVLIRASDLPGVIAKRTITKNRFVSVRSHETPRTESDKHCDQNKANV